jgi:hypothetical protein
MRKLVILLCALSLTSCQQIQQQQKKEAETAFMAALEGCRDAGEVTRENVMERIECVALAKRQFAADIHSPNEWILEQNLAADEESAVQYKEGKITRDEFIAQTKQHYAESAKTEALIVSQQRQRNIQALTALQGMLPQQQTIQPYSALTNQTIRTNCYGAQGYVNCQSYGQ